MIKISCILFALVLVTAVMILLTLAQEEMWTVGHQVKRDRLRASCHANTVTNFRMNSPRPHRIQVTNLTFMEHSTLQQIEMPNPVSNTDEIGL